MKKNNSIIFGIIVVIAVLASTSTPSLGSNNARGGYITEVNVTGFSLTDHWQGYYGVLNYTSPTSPTHPSYFNESGSNISSIRSITLVASPFTLGYILISNSSSAPNITSLIAGNPSTIDLITGTGSDSGTNTFTLNTTYTNLPYIGTIVAPTVYTYINSGESMYFREGFVRDGNDLVFIVPIKEMRTGYDGSSYNFQLILPNNHSNPITYYLYYLSQPAADLTLNSSDISLSPSDPVEGKYVEIIAIIHNMGSADADNFTVSFFDGNTLIGNDTISVGANGASSASVRWIPGAGGHSIKVVADAENVIMESNGTNNEASKIIGVRAAHFGGGSSTSPDTDGDGVPDTIEQLEGTDPFNPDTDQDGLNDFEERVLGTDPNNPDTDGDGLIDSEDSYPLNPNLPARPASAVSTPTITTPTQIITPAPTPIPAKPWWKIGFGLFTIVGLLIVIYLLIRGWIKNSLQ